MECSVAMLEAELAAAPQDPMCKYRAVFGEGRGVAWPKAQTYNAERQIETTTVSEWLMKQLR